jgi:hypothetical protein
MRSLEVAFTFSEEEVGIASDLGASMVPWRTFTGVIRAPKVWLLFLSRSQFVTLPLDAINEELRAFITSKLREHGADRVPR